MSRLVSDPDRRLLGTVLNSARQLAGQREASLADAVLCIRGDAAGREDVLTQAGGLAVGSWSVAPGMPADLLAAALLINSVERLDLSVLSHWLTTGQQRALSAARYRA